MALPLARNAHIGKSARKTQLSALCGHPTLLFALRPVFGVFLRDLAPLTRGYFHGPIPSLSARTGWMKFSIEALSLGEN
jgi:hypothetical protein